MPLAIFFALPPVILLTMVFFCEFIWCANRIERLESGLQLASLGGYVVLLIWAMGNP